MPYFKALLCKNREMSLINILSLLLFLSNFELWYSYKEYSNKKKRCNITRAGIFRKVKGKIRDMLF